MSKNISISAMDKVMKESYEDSINIDWYGNKLTIKKLLSLEEMVTFVSGVVDSCFAPDGDFIPEVKDYAIRYNVVRAFTNINMPEDNEHRYRILYRTDIFDVVVGALVDTSDQYYAMLGAVEEKIKYKSSANVDYMNKSFNKIVDDILDIADKSKALFSDVTTEDVQGVISALSGGKIDESKLMEAYMKSKSE